MLEVSIDLVAVVAMLVSIVATGHLTDVDSLNSPTAQPIPSGTVIMRFMILAFKIVGDESLFLVVPQCRFERAVISHSIDIGFLS